MKTRLTKCDYAAYLLDRADQYDTDSGCWVALADAAHNIMLGEVEDEETYRRLEAYAKEQGVTVKAVVEAAVHDVGRAAKG